MKKFLTAKHWQLFIPLVAIPLIVQSIIMGRFFSSFATQFENMAAGEIPVNPFASMQQTFIPFYAVMLLVVFVLVGWMAAVGLGLQYKIPHELKMKTGFFKFSLAFLPLYICLFCGMMTWMFSLFSQISITENMPDMSLIGTIYAIMFPLHLFAMFCGFYNMYFVAKTLKTAELQRKTTSSDYIGEFFLLWIFPIGLWFIQPRVNELVKEQDDFIIS